MDEDSDVTMLICRRLWNWLGDHRRVLCGFEKYRMSGHYDGIDRVCGIYVVIAGTDEHVASKDVGLVLLIWKLAQSCNTND